MKISDLMSKLYKSTNSALIDNQISHIPLVYELNKIKPTQFEYPQQKGFENCYQIINQNYIRKDLNKSEFASKDDLFNDGKIAKIICVDDNGMMVNDSNINIFIDERMAYVHSKNSSDNLKYCIVFKNGTSYDKSNPIMCVENGIFVGGVSNGLVISCSGLVSDIVYTKDGLIEPQNISNKYKIFKENIFVFKNGTFQGNSVSNVYGNVYKIDNFTEGDNWFVNIIYYKDDNCINNVNKIQSKIQLLQNLYKELPEYVEQLSDDFDYRLDMNKSYNENLNDILEYISNYNHEGLLQYYLENKSSILEEYTGKHFIYYMNKNDGMFHLPRRRKNKQYNYVIIYVNGLLYKYHNEIKYGITTIGIPVKDILPDDEILVQFFLDCSNKTSTTILKKGQTNIINYLSISSTPSNIELYSPEFEGKHLYDLSVDDMRPLKTGYEYELDDKKNMVVTLENPYLYGKELTVVNKRQYKYQRMQIPIVNRNKLNYKIYDIKNTISSLPKQRPTTVTEFESLFKDDILISEGVVQLNGLFRYTQLNEFPTEFQSEMIAIQLDGLIWIDKESLYTISVLSNSGSRLYIDDILVTEIINGQYIIDDFDTPYNRGLVQLDRGFHSIKLMYANHVSIPALSIGIKASDENKYTNISTDILYQEYPDYYILKLNEIDFRYCLNFGHYIMFNNGRRLYDNEAYVRLHGINQVYDQSYIFVSKPIPEGDYIDIFYVPDMVLEVHREDVLSEDGYITLDKDNMMNTFHPELCMIFVNGKLINPKKMVNLNTNTLKIKENINTLSSVSVLKTNIYDGLTNTIFEYSNDIWTEVSNELPIDIKNKLIGKFEDITNNEPDYFKPPCIDLTWAILKKFWIDRFGVIDADMLFQYNDDPRILRKSKIKHETYESYYYENNSNIAYKFIDNDGIPQYKFTCISPTTLKFGKFENLDVNEKWSLSMSVSLYLNLSNPTNRFYCEIYGSGGTERIPLCYNQESSVDISQIPKVYMIRLHLNNIPITSTKNNVRIVCEFKSSEEYIKFENGIYLEKGEFAIKNIESIMINPEIITGVRLPYGNEFDKE